MGNMGERGRTGEKEREREREGEIEREREGERGREREGGRGRVRERGRWRERGTDGQRAIGRGREGYHVERERDTVGGREGEFACKH